ncbi:MAG: ABC transporter substrate-binding protein [Actinomycetota bacterium]
MASVAVGSTLVAAPASAASDTLVLGFSLEPLNLDISGTAGQAIPQVLLNNVYEGLLRIEPDGKIVPGLAKSYSQSKDGLTWTFKLREAKFHDGRSLSSADVVWSFNRVLNPNDLSVLPAQKAEFKSVSSVTAKGPDTVVLALKERSNDLLFSLTQRGGVIFKAGTTNMATEANGTGPYKFKKWNRGNNIMLARNDGYWGPSAKTKNVVFRYILDTTALSNAMLTMQLDVLTAVAEPRLLSTFKKNKKLQVYSGTTNCEVVLSMNNSRAPFNNKFVRQAVRSAIDKDALIKTAVAGYGTKIGSFVPPTDPWYEDLSALFPYDTKKSKQLLAKGGYPNGFDVQLDVPPVFYALDSQEFIAASLKKVGINVTLKPVAWGEWIDRVFLKANYDMSIVCHVERNDMGIYADPNYYFKYNSAEYQNLIKKAGNARDAAAQAGHLKKAARVLAEDSPSDWLWLLGNNQVARKGVTGVPINSVGDAYSVASIAKN